MTNSLSIERPLRRLEPVSAAAAVKRDRRAETEAVRAAINRHIGRRVRSIRIARGRTQAELGEALGLTNQQVQKYEKGANGLSFERLWLMARYFDIDVHYFLDDMWDAAAIAFEDRSTAPAGAEPPQYPRLRLNATQAVHRVKSLKLLTSIVQLLRAEEEERAGMPDAAAEPQGDGGGGTAD